MSYAQDHFKSFADHTPLKHAILRSYLQQWASIYLSKRAGNPEVCFVDCFAGPGHDGDGKEGSPLIAARASHMIRGMTQSGALPAGGVLRFAAVERKQAYFNEMRESVEALIPPDPARLLLRKADYRDCLDDLRRFRGDAPCLTFLDPFGVSGLDAAAFAPLLAGAKTELLLLVSGIGAARLHGVLGADAREFAEALQHVRGSPTLFPELQMEEEARLQQEQEEYIEALDATKPASHKALLRALGSEALVERIQHADPAERPIAFVRAITGLLLEAGATYIVSIPMRDEKGTPKYTLLHASKSPRAVSAMKTAVSDGLKRDDLSAEMRERIRADLSVPAASYVTGLAEVRAGSGEYWAWGRKQRRQPSLQEVLLETTLLFDFQVPEVKMILKARGYLVRRDGHEWIEFPSRTT